MEPKYGWLYPTTPVASLLRARPAALAVFERFPLNPWESMHCGIREACVLGGVAWSDFSQALDQLRSPDSRADWTALPICHLLDFLSSEHRDFLEGFIPSIGRALSQDIDGDFDSLQHLRAVASEWPGFVAALTEHIREEEEVLFLRVLRYDTSLRLGWGDPDVKGGSVGVFATVRMLNHEHRDVKLMMDFLERARLLCPAHGEPSALAASLRPVLDGFSRQLRSHARLEQDVLIPLAMAMEKKLYDQLIRGGGRPSQAGGASRRKEPGPTLGRELLDRDTLLSL